MSLRSFIAIGMPAEVVEALCEAQEALRAAMGGVAVKWSRPSGMHLTLRFLGDIREDTIPALEGALGPVCAVASPFDLALDGLGAFPSARRARVIWAGIGGDTAGLGRLAAAVNAAVGHLVPGGEARDFVPHLTLGRLGQTRREDLDALAAALASVCPDPARWRVRSVLLMRSILRPGAAEHTVLSECRLGSAATSSSAHPMVG